PRLEILEMAHGRNAGGAGAESVTKFTPTGAFSFGFVLETACGLRLAAVRAACGLASCNYTDSCSLLNYSYLGRICAREPVVPPDACRRAAGGLPPHDSAGCRSRARRRAARDEMRRCRCSDARSGPAHHRPHPG